MLPTFAMENDVCAIVERVYDVMHQLVELSLANGVHANVEQNRHLKTDF